MGRASGARSGRDTAKLGQDLPKRVYVSRKGEKNTRRQDNAPAGDNQAKSKRHCAAPGERHTTKHRGDVYEMHFMIEASNRGFGVSKPFGDNERYDIILDGGRRLWRVQVKGTECVHKTDSRFARAGDPAENACPTHRSKSTFSQLSIPARAREASGFGM